MVKRKVKKRIKRTLDSLFGKPSKEKVKKIKRSRTEKTLDRLFGKK